MRHYGTYITFSILSESCQKKVKIEFTPRKKLLQNRKICIQVKINLIQISQDEINNSLVIRTRISPENVNKIREKIKILKNLKPRFLFKTVENLENRFVFILYARRVFY